MIVNLGTLVSSDPNHAIFFDLNKESIAAYLKNTEAKINKLFEYNLALVTDEKTVTQMVRKFLLQLRYTKELEKWILFSPETETFKQNIEAAVISLFRKTHKKLLEKMSPIT